MKKLLLSLCLGIGLVWAGAALAQSAEPPKDAPAAAETAAPTPAPAATEPAAAEPAAAAAAAVTVDKGDVAWMMTATLLVILMVLPGLALFYGGLVRSKNMLSVLMQVMMVFSLITVLWAIYGYSLAFGGEGAIIGSLDKVFLAGVTTASLADTFTENVKLPELIFVAFQATFAGITCALIVGSFAERIKFSAVLLFSALWFTFSYLPIAHMVWGPGGYLLDKGALDFAGGTVVHINAAMAGLVGAYLLGKRIGYGREAMPPHSLTPIDQASTAAAVASSVLRNASAAPAVAGLVAITPACGSVGPMGSIVIGLVAGFVCLWGVTGLKKMLGADDSLDVFGVHGVGGIVGALLTGVFAAPGLGGTGAEDFSIASQLWVQAEGVIITMVWSSVVAFIAYKIVDMVIGLRVTEEEEREGLDITYHGESAYNR